MEKSFALFAGLILVVLMISVVFAAKPEKIDVKAEIEQIKSDIIDLWDAISGLETEVLDLQNTTDDLQLQINDLEVPQPSCPNDMVEVSGFCIDKDETVGSWFDSSSCYDQGKELCNPSKWVYACNNPPVGLNDMVGNWEVTDNLNSLNELKGVIILGESSCSEIDFSEVSVVRAYRCCLDL